MRRTLELRNPNTRWISPLRVLLRSWALICWAPFLATLAVLPTYSSEYPTSFLVVLLTNGMAVPILLRGQPHFAALCGALSAA